MAGPQTVQSDILFFKKETVRGTLVAPVAADAVLVIADPDFSQPLPFIENPERITSLSKTEQISGRYSEGNFGFSCLARPSGVAGTIGVPDQCMEGMFGRKTDGAVDVKYDPQTVAGAATHPTYSAFLRRGDIIFQHSGCVFNHLDVPVKADPSAAALHQLNFSGLFMRQRIAGKTTCATAGLAGDNHLHVATGTAKYFDDGCFVMVVDKDDGTIKIPSLAVTTVDYGTDQLNITGTLGVAVDIGDFIQGAMPVESVGGHIINMYLGTPQWGGVDLPLVDATISFDVPVQMLTDEKNGQLYPTDFLYGLDKRSVQVDTSLYFKNEHHKAWYEARIGTTGLLDIPMGTLGGYIVDWRFPKAQYMATPSISGNPLMINRTFIALCTGGGVYDDEIQSVWK